MSLVPEPPPDPHAAEQAEIAELKAMLSATADTIRESDITASKYNKWLVGEHNRDTGGSIRSEVANLKTARHEFHSRHMQYGASLSAQARQRPGTVAGSQRSQHFS